jgi:hypothetical protein
MPQEIVIQRRVYETKVDSAIALAMHRDGKSLRQIAAAIAPTASRMAVSRAIQRAKKAVARE